MRSRAFRPIAAILSVLLLAGSPVHAGPVAISEVIQVLASYQNPPELRLRSSSQTGSTAVAGASGSTRATSSVKQSAVDSSINDSPAASTNTPDSLLAGLSTGSEDPLATEIIDQGDVDGTVCDCGEITVPGGGFPKWPLLFLAAIPFFFIHDCDDCEKSTPTPTPFPTPTPTPPGTPVPEPASLLLFGSGLAAFGAGFRRRYAKAKLTAKIQTTEEG